MPDVPYFRHRGSERPRLLNLRAIDRGVSTLADGSPLMEDEQVAMPGAMTGMGARVTAPLEYMPAPDATDLDVWLKN